jgi:RNA polymerase sigma-70 factor, ECF subfamily
MPNPDRDDKHVRFFQLFTEHEGALRVFLRALLPSREAAAEAFQETSIVLWEKFGEYDRSRDFKAWAFGIARNKALASIRDRQRQRLVFSDDLLNQLAEEAERMAPSTLTHEEALAGCLQKLSEPVRELVLTAYTKGTRIDDLARRLGRTPMSLYKKLHRIRQSLLACVEQTLARGGVQ